MALSEQEERFCLEYVGNGKKATVAAIAAGYPASIAKKLLNRADIRDEIKLYEPPKVIDTPQNWAATAEFGQ